MFFSWRAPFWQTHFCSAGDGSLPFYGALVHTLSLSALHPHGMHGHTPRVSCEGRHRWFERQRSGAAILGKRVLTLNGEFSEQSVGEGGEADSHAAEAVVALLPQG